MGDVELKIMELMKKVILGALALVVPMVLVSYAMHFVGNVAVTLFGIITMCAMVAYTVTKFYLIGHRGYRNMNDSFRYASVGNAFWAFGYIFVIFCGAKLSANGLALDPCRFTPLMATVAYMCMLGIIACIAHLLKEKDIDVDRKALMTFLAMLLFCVAIGCCGEILKSYNNALPDTEALSAILMLSAGGVAVAGYRSTKHNEELEHA